VNAGTINWDNCVTDHKLIKETKLDQFSVFSHDVAKSRK